jgi:uncharacterized membrane protein YtjA (UPF0391 family)
MIFKGEFMLRIAILFSVLALLAAYLGFGGVASYTWAGAKVLFFLFLVLAVLSYLRVFFYLRRKLAWNEMRKTE